MREIELCFQSGGNCGQKEFILPELYEIQTEENAVPWKENTVTYKHNFTCCLWPSFHSFMYLLSIKLCEAGQSWGQLSEKFLSLVIILNVNKNLYLKLTVKLFQAT